MQDRRNEPETDQCNERAGSRVMGQIAGRPAVYQQDLRENSVLETINKQIAHHQDQLQKLSPIRDKLLRGAGIGEFSRSELQEIVIH